MPAHTLTTPHPVDLSVEIDSGSIRIRAVEPAFEHTTATVQVEGKRADEVTVTQSGDAIAVIGPRSSGMFKRDGDLHVTIDVPLGSSLTTRTGSADLHVEGTLAQARVRTGSGDTQLGVLTGAATVESGSGDVRIDHAQADLRIKSGSGDVALGAADGTASVSTGSGDIAIEANRGATTVKTGSGDVSVTSSTADVSLTTGSGDLSIGTTTRGRVVVKGASSDVNIGIPSGTPVWTDISSISGRVRSTLTPVGEPAEGQDHVELRVTTVSGDVTLLER